MCNLYSIIHSIRVNIIMNDVYCCFIFLVIFTIRIFYNQKKRKNFLRIIVGLIEQTNVDYMNNNGLWHHVSA